MDTTAMCPSREAAVPDEVWGRDRLGMTADELNALKHVIAVRCLQERQTYTIKAQGAAVKVMRAAANVLCSTFPRVEVEMTEMQESENNECVVFEVAANFDKSVPGETAKTPEDKEEISSEHLAEVTGASSSEEEASESETDCEDAFMFSLGTEVEEVSGWPSSTKPLHTDFSKPLGDDPAVKERARIDMVETLKSIRGRSVLNIVVRECVTKDLEEIISMAGDTLGGLTAMMRRNRGGTVTYGVYTPAERCVP